ncbi:MAG TPA: DUF2142 domain-containing protein [Solirubrobacteraceae bacterium]|jgi:hypothetical protein|nr:DUF2142 domain-containing protein [Solirubrobacteraceae bacterium]
MSDQKAPEKAGAPEKTKVGSRAFVRRERAAVRRRTARRTRQTAGPQSRGATALLELSLVRALRRIPRAALVCALVACLNAICWSIVTPAFEVPDEPAHFAYVKQLAETGTLPWSKTGDFSSEELGTLIGLDYYKVRQQPQDRSLAAHVQQLVLDREMQLSARESEKGSAAAGAATGEPPLYYALEAIPYTLARGGTVLTRLQLMRIFSALLAGVTAMFAFLFLREALPREPWAWTVGGLAVALVPLLGFMSGAVNPDAMLFAVSTVVFYWFARAFRRGMTLRGAVAIGALTAIGLLTKLNFVGLVPGIVLGVLVLGARVARTSRRSALGMLALALGIGLSPALVYGAINVLSNHPLFGVASVTANLMKGSILAELDYVWQLFLPRLPGTAHDFPGLFTTRQLWFDGYVGLFGWLDTTFPAWVYDVALIPAGAIALLCGRALVAGRAALRSRAVELAVYATIGIGLLVLVGVTSYQNFPTVDAETAQARYLLPLLALLGAVVALAARGAGRRWGPAAGTLIVVLFLAHDIFSQMLVAARFYG